MRPLLLVVVIAGLAFSAFWITGTALAHEKVTIGQYTFEIGWLVEPALVGEKNAVIVSVVNFETGEPVEGLSTMKASVSIGGRSKDLSLRPLAEELPGQYAADIIPTVRGVYILGLSGTLAYEAFEVSIDLDEVGEASALQFPEPAPSTLDLQKRLATAEAALTSTRTTAYAAMGVGGASLLIVLVALFRRSAR